MSDTALLLRKPWSNLSRQREGATLGIWIFLASEMLFFGALLLAYTANRVEHPDAFSAAARETNVFYGTLNTAILLTSSLTMAVATKAAGETALQARRLIIGCLTTTALLGLAFLVVKGFEYAEDIEKHLVPGNNQFPVHLAGAQIFFALYWIITAVHAIHLSIGIVLVLRLVLIGLRQSMPLRRNAEVEVTGLYWHLVDIIWIFVYPLIYLPGRSL
jgi:cytochrome c oxidase subunit III